MVSEVTFSAETTAAELRPVLLRLARELRKDRAARHHRTPGDVALAREAKPGLSLAALASEEGISAPAMSGMSTGSSAQALSSVSARTTTDGVSASA